ncbi:MAG: D-3-phosphoglycerate dehydrogenase [uncultured Thermomicrobiales bacterium]|uniref:D-3-phosphoglycerate dehydrogenase n=1 Tax=uncultured Thermomicrobiales bacterium TaxID=1645740 RepID=A0A6J4TVT9_9BACT|nr:MAG: D-3-phosphoglycerate dehydrogenase [uncultured Thermomicrobiales bacterium]
MAGVTVAVTRAIPEAGLDRLNDAPEIGDVRLWADDLPPDPEELVALLAGCAGALTLLTDQIDAEILDRVPGLRVVSNYAVGYDNIDVEAATERGVAVCNTPGILTETTADLAFALLMASARRIPEGVDYVRAGRWQTWGPRLLLGQDIHGATLGIVGLGRIGQAVAARARGFGMRILATARHEDPVADELGVEYRDLDDLLREADFVSLHVDLSPETTGMIGADELALMKPTATLINTARGPVVDTGALVEALREGTIAGAALDVTDPEPLSADHPLLALPNALVVPHIASATVATRDRMATVAADNLLAVLRGRRPEHIVNPEILA